MSIEATEDDGAPLDILRDLQFLIANDDQLDKELTYVCELLDGSGSAADDETTSGAESSSVSSPPPPPLDVTPTRDGHAAGDKTKPVRSSVRQREEILLLRKQVDVLTARLRARDTTDTTTYDMSLWERTAKLENIEKKRAIQENEELKEAVYQQATFIEQMQRVFRKKPRVGVSAHPLLNLNLSTMQGHFDIHSEAWQTYRLAAQASLREAAIHAIADRQYRRLQSAFVKAGVFDREHYKFHIQAEPQPADKAFLVEMINHLTLDAPFRLVGSVAWQVFDSETAPDMAEGAMEISERIDPFTVYSKLRLTPPGAAVSCHSNMIRKYYVEPDREVIVSRTVLEDAAVPHMSKGAVENRCMWLQVVPLPGDPNQCRFTILQQLVWPFEDEAKTTSSDEMDSVVQVMKRVCFGSAVARRGTIPMAVEMDLSQLPYPGMAAFAERGRRFMRVLKANVNDAIETYHSTT
ncbi:Aste57867_23726 [Aphanomyces stellatus]|uniref:Aste57867_23726 protein n=1 Tax=Aphanomyces stellatus TaxID=120398 RepID=A0A485LNM5_9STRA|nr:hypothetical protein As57867_023654 [Aphanomyces stellatus]VFU00371.1 Aste57867_23726 [Aphanomyces stellatus]